MLITMRGSCRGGLCSFSPTRTNDILQQLVPTLVLPAGVVYTEANVSLLHLAQARTLAHDACRGRTVARIPVALKIEKRKAAHVAHTLRVSSEVAHKLEDLWGMAG